MNKGQNYAANKCLVVITGPTAVGKTSTAIKIAKEFSSEIISADSRQFFKEMKIGTAVPNDEELTDVSHYLIGNLTIYDYYNVFKFEQDALKIIDELFLRHNILFMVGGSGLYIDTVCNGIDPLPDPDPEIREQLNLTFTKHGILPLREQLKLLDPLSYENLDIANHKRIIRALEVCILTGKPYSDLLKNETSHRYFKIIKIGLKLDRVELYDRINKRVDQMMTEGLEEEAKSLYPYRQVTALNTVGYRELFHYFEGNCSLSEAVEKIKVNTRRYAKKQMTWFTRDKDIHWFHPNEIDGIMAFIDTQTKED